MVDSEDRSDERRELESETGLDLEPLLDQLYSEPLAAFIEARKSLTSQLQKADRSADAEAVKTLKKPVVTAWAVNQLALRDDRSHLDALLDAGEEVRKSQAGASAPAAHRDAVTERRRALDKALAVAEDILVEAGHSPTQGSLQRISRSLEAVAAYGRTGACQPAPGRLHDDLEPPGFEVLLELAALEPRLAQTPATKKGKGAKPQKGRGRANRSVQAPQERERRARQRALEKERSTVSKQLERARATSRKLAEARRDAERKVVSQQKLVDKARARLDDLVQAHEEMAKTLAASTQDHRGAELETLEIEKRLARIDAELATPPPGAKS